MTREIAEAFLSELRDLCKKHQVRMIGTCHSESILGEITLEDAYKDSDWQIQDVSFDTVYEEVYSKGGPVWVYIRGAM